MNIKTLVIFTLSIFSLLTTSAQQNTVVIDLTQLTNKANMYIRMGGMSSRIPDNGIVELLPETLPNLAQLIENKGNRVMSKKYIWVESNVTMSGSFTAGIFNISQISKEQKIADQLLQTRDIDESSPIFGSRPHLVLLSNHMEQKTVGYLRNAIGKGVAEGKSFWAIDKIQKYLDGLKSVGYDSETRIFTSVTGMNKAGDWQEFRPDPNKLLLVDFSGSWCRPCLEELGELRELSDKYKEQLEVVTLWNDLSQEFWLTTGLKPKEKINWTSLRDDTGAIFKIFEITVFPTYMLFDKSGELIKRRKGNGVDKLESAITKQL